MVQFPHKLNPFLLFRKTSWLLLALAIVCSTLVLFQPLGRSQHTDAREHALIVSTCANGLCDVTLTASEPSRRADRCATGSTCRSIKLRAAPSAWSLAGWVRLDEPLDDVLDTTAISYGPASLKFAAPAVPYLAVETAWPEVHRRFEHKPSLRGHCAELSIAVRRTQTFDDALRQCVQLPGCVVVTRNSHDLSTHFCQAAYSIEAYDPGWASAILWDAPPIRQYTGAVAVKSWNYFVLTYEAGKLQLYVNGFLRQSVALHAADSRWIDLGWSGRWFEQAFPGQIGNLRFWSRSLQPNEVAASMWKPLAGSDLWVNVTPSGEWEGPPAIRSGWSSPAPLTPPQNCEATVVVPLLGGNNSHVGRAIAHLQQYPGQACRVKVLLVACSASARAGGPGNEGGVDTGLGGQIRGNAELLQTASRLSWDACVHTGLQRALQAEPQPPFVAVVADNLLPMDGWLAGLVRELQADPDAAVAFSKVLNVDGTIKTAGAQLQQAYVGVLDRQAVWPVELYAGYPWNYARASKTQQLRAAGCAAWAMRASAAREVLADDGAFTSDLGSFYACTDLLLRLRKAGHSALLAPASVLLEAVPRAAPEDSAAIRTFGQVWGAQLMAEYEAGLALNATVTWVMHCGGSMGIEAYNLVQYMEGSLRLRAQIQRGRPFCEHVDVLSGTPTAFSDRIQRLRHLTGYLPSDIMIHHKDYRQLAAWPWPPNNSTSYLIGRYMWEVDRVHRQWADQMKHELDEVWVPSHWHAASAEEQGVPRDKVVVIPESLDSYLYDPGIWEPLTLPRQRRVTFLAVFKLEDRKGWQVLLAAYLKAFREYNDTSLFIHTVNHPDISYRRDLIYDKMNAFLRESNDSYLQSLSLGPNSPIDAPHVFVIGQHLSQHEMIRIYASADVFVVPSRGEGWGLPYMEAMSMGKPIIATNWSGMTEFLRPDFAFLLNYTIAPVRTTDKWFQGAMWAEPSQEDLIYAFLDAYEQGGGLQELGRRARQQVVSLYDNEVVGRQITARLAEISAKLAPRADRPAKRLDMSKDPMPVDVHLCGMSPLSRVTTHRTGAAIKIAVVTTAPPRRCGIATFNTALMDALTPLLPPGSSVETFPLIYDVEMPKSLDGSDVDMTPAIRQKNFGDYMAAAQAINEGFHVALLQHEFGIWGGTYGSFIVCFTRMLTVPSVSIVHTLSDNLYDEHQYILQHLAGASTAIVVMSEASRNKLGAYHGVPADKVAVLPHGAPRLTGVTAEEAKAALNLTGRTVLMTNGLIHPGKGIDLALAALPAVVKEFPDVVYMIVGEPHPDCGKICDEHYKHLLNMAADARIRDNVQFVRAFLDDDLLTRYVQAADLYVLPYRDRITTNSGTLTMALAAGKACVSTPFEHAASALVGRGRLVEFDNADSLQEGILDVLRDEGLQVQYQKAAREYATHMDWLTVAKGYLALLQNVTA